MLISDDYIKGPVARFIETLGYNGEHDMHNWISHACVNKWLIKEHKIMIVVNPTVDGNTTKYFYAIYDVDPGHQVFMLRYNIYTMFKHPEEAFEKAIIEALKILKLRDINKIKI